MILISIVVFALGIGLAVVNLRHGQMLAGVLGAMASVYYFWSYLWSRAVLAGYVSIQSNYFHLDVSASGLMDSFLVLSFSALATFGIAHGWNGVSRANSRQLQCSDRGSTIYLALSYCAIVGVLYFLFSTGIVANWSRDPDAGEGIRGKGLLSNLPPLIPLAICSCWRLGRKIRGIHAVPFVVYLCVMLFSGRTTEVVGVVFSLTVVFFYFNVDSRRIGAVISKLAVGGIVFVIVITGYRSLRGMGESYSSSRSGGDLAALSLVNSFSEVWAFAGGLLHTRQYGYFGVTPYSIAIYAPLPTALLGNEKNDVLTESRIDYLVGKDVFGMDILIPVTMFGEAYMAFGFLGLGGLVMVLGWIIRFLHRQICFGHDFGFLCAVSLLPSLVTAFRGSFATFLSNGFILMLMLSVVFGVVSVGAAFLRTESMAFPSRARVVERRRA